MPQAKYRRCRMLPPRPTPLLPPGIDGSGARTPRRLEAGPGVAPASPRPAAGSRRRLALTLPFPLSWLCPASGPGTRRAGFRPRRRRRCGLGQLTPPLWFVFSFSTWKLQAAPGSEVIGVDFKPLATSKCVLCLWVREELMRNC